LETIGNAEIEIAVKSLITHAIKVAITLGLLFAIFHKIGAASIVTQFRKLSVGSIALCVIFSSLQQWVIASRFSGVVELCGGHLNRRRSLRLCIESMFFSQAFISILGGDIFRAWRLRSSGLLPVDIARALIFDRFNALVLNHLLLVAAVLPVLPLIGDRKITLGIVIIALGGLAGLAALIIVGMVIEWVRDFAPIQRMTERSRWVAAALDIAVVGRLFINGRRSIKISLFSLIGALINCILLLLLLTGMDVPIKITVACALLTPLLVEISVLPISVAGWGLREGAAGFLFGAVGLDAERAVTASVAFGLLALLVGMVGGVLWLLDHFDLKRTTATAESHPVGK
jgi:glycosyltransferase 2 family protein